MSYKSDMLGSCPQLIKAPLASHKETRMMRLWGNSEPVLHWDPSSESLNCLQQEYQVLCEEFFLEASWQKQVCGVSLLALMKPASPFLVHSALPGQRHLVSIRERESAPSHATSALKPSLFPNLCQEPGSDREHALPPNYPGCQGSNTWSCVCLPGQSRYFTHRQDTEEFQSQKMEMGVKRTLFKEEINPAQ